MCALFRDYDIIFHDLPTEAWLRFFPRKVREFRRHHLVDWRELMERARRQSKFRFEGSNFYVHVISLPRMRKRSLQTLYSLEKQGIPWKFHDGYDGLDPLDLKLVKKYAGPKKMRRIRMSLNIGQTQLLQLKCDIDSSKQLSTKLRRSLHERLRFGCFMSHVLLWKDILSMSLPFAIILEDDATITLNFKNDLRSRLNRLPIEWDLLFLNGCFKKFGPVFDTGLLQSRGGLCTFGYVISEKGMRHLLQHPVLQSEKPIDHVIDEEILSGRLLAFHADPPLALTSLMKSTLAY